MIGRPVALILVMALGPAGAFIGPSAALPRAWQQKQGSPSGWGGGAWAPSPGNRGRPCVRGRERGLTAAPGWRQAGRLRGRGRVLLLAALPPPLPRTEILGGVEVRHEKVQVSDAMFLHVADAGEPGAPVCVLLHGFPDFWYSWRAQIPALTRGGYRVLCPDLRGYGESGKCEKVAAFSQAELTKDLEALRVHYCGDRPFELLVGHDWGGGVAYAAMLKLQGSLSKRLAVLNMFHPACFKKGLSEDGAQQRKSWYIAAFQAPFLGEALIPLGDYFLLRRMFKKLDRPPDPENLKLHLDACMAPGALNGGLNYYRAFGSGLWPHFSPDLPGPVASFVRALSGVSLAESEEALAISPPASQALDVPVLILFGKRDRYLSVALARPPSELVPLGTYKEIDATHWVHWDAPDNVNLAILSFLEQQ